ncbi:hypothetical protein GCM10010166_55830 [Couchioplanes caeruleus subsp. azureus]|nr:hypothetical protein GCM10010166_55830 [Couchioplanes caeruleus subsp. azureus]
MSRTRRSTGRDRDRIERVLASERPLREANFLPKSQRKVVRKSMVRAYLANKMADARVDRMARVEFYRNLRQIKLRRRKIAAEMRVLADLVSGLYREVIRIDDRHVGEIRVNVGGQRTGMDMAVVDEATDLLKTASGATSAAADEFDAFSRRKVYYTEVAA